MKKNVCLAALLLLCMVSISFGQAVYPATVVLEAGGHDVEVPDFQKFKADLETGIKKLLVKDSIKVLKFNHDSTAIRAADCNLLTCFYKISYAQGMMLNAHIECALSFTDCHKKEIYTLSEHRMVGAVAGMKDYLKLFERMVKPDLLKKIRD